jgi:anti-sigma-K factor RskA
MKSGNRELVDRLAAEYVLGTLRGGARRHFERWLRSPQVRAMVHAWEERLAGFEPAPQRVAPPAQAWEGIEQRLELRRIRRAPVMRWVAIGGAALLLAILAGVFFSLKTV